MILHGYMMIAYLENPKEYINKLSKLMTLASSPAQI